MTEIYCRQDKARRGSIYQSSYANSERQPLISSQTNGKKYSFNKSTEDTRADKNKEKKGGPSLFMVLARTFGRSMLISWGFKFIYDLLQFVSPMILK